MKRALLVSFAILFASETFSQLLSWSPAFVQEASTPVVITMDATRGNQRQIAVSGKSGYDCSDVINGEVFSLYYYRLKIIDKDVILN
ncbi:MAG: hypothetical protein M3139_03520 [Bacteroidota bacterium]|nr:hypothetical protein [Bacteroidota bacterium]